MKAIITAKPGATKVNIANWLRHAVIAKEITSAATALIVARRLCFGDELQFDSWQVDKTENEYCRIVEVSEPATESELWFRQQTEFAALLKKGAEGNIEAALAYCKLEFEGKVSHGAYAP